MNINIHVRITPSNEDQSLFQLQVNANNKAWIVERSRQDFVSLQSSLRQDYQSSSFVDISSWKDIDLKNATDINVLETVLVRILASLGDRVWMTESLVSFLDNVPRKSPMAELQMTRLTQQIESLSRRSQELESFQQELQNNYLDLLEKLRVTNNVMPPFEGFYSGADAGRLNSHRKTTNGEVPRLSLISVITTDSASTTTTNMPVMASMEGPTYMSDDEMGIMTGRSPLMSGDFTPTPVRSGSLEPIREEDVASLIGLAQQQQVVSEVPPAMPNSPYLPTDLLPLGEKSIALDPSIDNILKLIGPTEEQIQHRASIVGMLKRQIRLAIGATAFEIGLPVSRCLLPDDPIKLTVVISKSTMPTWHMAVCEQLTTFAEKANMFGGSSYVPMDEDEILDPYFTDCHSYGSHMLSGVTHSKQNLIHSVQLVVDSIPVEIAANMRTELCMLSFFEEVNALVGKEQLFKRAFLLIRAWWAYETPSFVGCVIRHYLTDQHLFVMLTSIFNRFHEHIATPLHALSLFLAEYSSYDGSTACVSLQGTVGFQTRSSNQPQLSDVHNIHYLIDPKLLEKHWQSFNIGHFCQDSNTAANETGSGKKRSSSTEDHSLLSSTSNPSPTINQLLSSSNLSVGSGSAGSSPNKTNNLLNNVLNNSNTTTSTAANPTAPVALTPFQQQQQDALVRETMKTLSTNNLYFFERSAFNIIHPLAHTNMMTEKLSQRRISRLYKAFQIGATNFAFYLKRAIETGVSSTEGDVLKNYFPTILTHANVWNKSFQEINLSAILTSSYDQSRVDYDVVYCNLLLESVVTDPALQLLAMEILAQKGPLPVGEIGKILAEMTSIPSLSLKLKEKFGGLKKFLEQYPSLFVVSNDHPFNPNVLLRCSLSNEHLELIDKGIFPHQLLIKAKKAAAASAKKKKSHSVPNFVPPVINANMGPGSGNGANDMMYRPELNPSMYRVSSATTAASAHMSSNSSNMANNMNFAKMQQFGYSNNNKHSSGPMPGSAGGVAGGMSSHSGRSKSIPSSKSAYANQMMYESQQQQANGMYGVYNNNGPPNNHYMDDSPNSNNGAGAYHHMHASSAASSMSRRGYNPNGGDFNMGNPNTASGNAMMGGGSNAGAGAGSAMAYSSNNSSNHYFIDDMLGNTSSGAETSFLLAQLSAGNVPGNSGGSGSGRHMHSGGNHHPFVDSSPIMTGGGGVQNNFNNNHDPHQSYSVMSSLFPMKLTNEELNSLGFGPTSNAGGSNTTTGLANEDHGRDYSSLPPNMF